MLTRYSEPDTGFRSSQNRETFAHFTDGGTIGNERLGCNLEGVSSEKLKLLEKRSGEKIVE